MSSETAGDELLFAVAAGRVLGCTRVKGDEDCGAGEKLAGGADGMGRDFAGFGFGWGCEPREGKADVEAAGKGLSTAFPLARPHTGFATDFPGGVGGSEGLRAGDFAASESSSMSNMRSVPESLGLMTGLKGVFCLAARRSSLS